MSALGELAGAAGSAVMGGLWKVGAIVLSVLMVVGGAGMGFEWWLAARDRDVARADLVKERGVSAGLLAGIGTQNTAILAQAKLAREAEARGDAAQQAAAVKGRRYDAALAKLTGQHATTCGDAMPAVNQLLKDVK